ncbi:MAG: BlaI/MecI/CopY family transcriptional regulator [Terriglobales bacterium]|jgi:predicted transcriptional regulator
MFQRLKSSLLRARHLGPLEDELLRVLWTRGDATVRELVDDSAVDGAYTTIMTTLDRLYKKGLLGRSSEGRAFRYRPKQSEAELHRGVVAAGLRELLSASNPTEAPLSFLVETISEHDAALLDELQQAVDKKRRELRKLGTR